MNKFLNINNSLRENTVARFIKNIYDYCLRLLRIIPTCCHLLLVNNCCVSPVCFAASFGGCLLGGPYMQYAYVRPHRVGFLQRFGLKTDGYTPCPFWSGIGYGFRGNYRVYERIYRFNSKWVGKKEKYANSKWIWTRDYKGDREGIPNIHPIP